MVAGVVPGGGRTTSPRPICSSSASRTGPASPRLCGMATAPPPDQRRQTRTDRSSGTFRPLTAQSWAQRAETELRACGVAVVGARRTRCALGTKPPAAPDRPPGQRRPAFSSATVGSRFPANWSALHPPTTRTHWAAGVRSAWSRSIRNPVPRERTPVPPQFQQVADPAANHVHMRVVQARDDAAAEGIHDTGPRTDTGADSIDQPVQHVAFAAPARQPCRASSDGGMSRHLPGTDATRPSTGGRDQPLADRSRWLLERQRRHVRPPHAEQRVRRHM